MSGGAAAYVGPASGSAGVRAGLLWRRSQLRHAGIFFESLSFVSLSEDELSGSDPRGITGKFGPAAKSAAV